MYLISVSNKIILKSMLDLKNLLRNYIDHDTSIYENSQCFFSSEGTLLSYSHRIKGKSWLKIRYSDTNLYYNSNFTEFDTHISQIDLRLYASLLNFSKDFIL